MTTNPTPISRKPRTWLALIVNLMLVALVLLLLRSNRFLTHEQLAQVRLGMTVEEAHRLLGLSRSLEDHQVSFGPIKILSGAHRQPGELLGRIVTGGMQFTPNDPFYSAIDIPQEGNEILHRLDLPPREGRVWLGRDRLLWVQVDDQDVIRNACILTYREQGGGIFGWLKYQYGRWFSGAATTPPVRTMAVPAVRKPGS